MLIPPRARPARRPARRAACEPLEGRRLLAAGDLDTTFGGDGRVTAAFDLGGGGTDFGQAVAIDSLGRAVAVGLVQRGTTDYDFGIARFNPDGSPDPNFGVRGKAVVSFDRGGGLFDSAHDVAIDSLGRIVVVGQVEFSGGDFDFGVARLLADGSPDTSFSGDGKTTIAFDNGGAD